MYTVSLRPGILAVLALLIPLSASGNEELARLNQNPNYWSYPGGNYGNWRYSELSQINNRNASRMVAAWTFSTGHLQGHGGGPLVLPSDATGLETEHMFVHSSFPNEVFAVNLETLQITWSYRPRLDEEVLVPVMCCDNVNLGLGYGDGKIFLQQADTRLVALNARTGTVAWAAENGRDIGQGPQVGNTASNAPHVIGEKVFTGCNGGEFGVRCWVSAYNIDDGSLAWRAYSTGPDEDILFDPENTLMMGQPVGPESSLRSWCAEGDWNRQELRASDPAQRRCQQRGTQWQQGGGSVTGWWAADLDANLVYYGTGSPGNWNPQSRPGDNRWTSSIIARDINTGVARWVYQMTPHDEWSYDGDGGVMLVDMQVNGQTRRTLVHFDSNGFAYIHDRLTGELLQADKYDPAVNWADRVDLASGYPGVMDEYSPHAQGEGVATDNICPAAIGAKGRQPSAYSPRTGLFYVPTNHLCMRLRPQGTSEAYTPGQPYINAAVSLYPAGEVCPDCPNNNTAGNNMGNLIAWDAGRGRIAWNVPERWSVWSGVLATAGDVVFYGTLDGYAKAVDAKSGQLLWQFKNPSGIVGNINAWAYKGKQYVGVLSGVGGWAVPPVNRADIEAAREGVAPGVADAYRQLLEETRRGGNMMVFSLP